MWLDALNNLKYLPKLCNFSCFNVLYFKQINNYIVYNLEGHSKNVSQLGSSPFTQKILIFADNIIPNAYSKVVIAVNLTYQATMYDPWFSFYKIRFDGVIMTSYVRFIGEEKFKPYPDVYKKSYFAGKYTSNKQIARNYKRVLTNGNVFILQRFCYCQGCVCVL